MRTKVLLVTHLVFNHVLLRPLRYFDEASLETMPSSWCSAQDRKNAAASAVNSSLNKNGCSLGQAPSAWLFAPAMAAHVGRYRLGGEGRRRRRLGIRDATGSLT